MVSFAALRRLAAFVLPVLAMLPSWPASAEHLKIGVLRLGQAGPVFIAQDKGYFAAEGLDTEVVLFDAAQPIAVAVASGDLAFGATALTAGLYSLGGQGALRIVAGMNRYHPGFHSVAYLVANRAWDAGLISFKDFGGHSVAVTQIGSGYHYSLALITAKYGVDLKSMRVMPVQTMPNIALGADGNQADAALLATTPATPLLERQEAHLLGWVDDETPWQNGAVFVATKTATERRDLVEKFLRAFRKGTRDYHNAYTEKPMAGPNIEEVAGLCRCRGASRRQGRAASNRLVYRRGHAQRADRRGGADRQELCDPATAGLSGRPTLRCFRRSAFASLGRRACAACQSLEE